MRDALQRRFDDLGARTALWSDGVAYTYGDLAERIRALRALLDRHGVAAHEAVVLNADFSPDAIAALFALYLNRNTVVPIVRATEAALSTVAQSCAPRHRLVVERGAEPVFEPLPVSGASSSAAAERLAAEGAAGLVLLSSGSTGAPKAILHNLDLLIEEKLGRRAPGRSSSLTILMVLMFDHIGGINSLLSTLFVGGCAVLPRERTPAEICALVERHKVRVLPSSPTFLNLIVLGGYHEKYDLGSVRLITYGTEQMPEALLKRVGEAFPGARLLQTFGTSETGIAATASESSRSTYFRISGDATDHRIVDGELQLRSRTQFLGYLNYPDDSITEDGWFRTGDLVEQNAQGYIRVTGRATERITVGGEKLLPLELESILLASPLIADCVVYGRPNAITGQTVCVDVKPVGELTRAQARAHVREFLAGKVEPFKIPSKVTVVDDIGVSERLKKVRSRQDEG